MTSNEVTYEQAMAFQTHVAVVLAATGYVVHETHTGGAYAPALRLEHGRVTAPDLLVASRNWQVPCHVDTKLKNEAPMYRLADELRTGIDLDAFHAYRYVQERTGLPVFLIFGHRKENEVRICALDDPSVAGVGAGGRMRYWAYESLQRLCSLDDIRAKVPLVLPSPPAVQAESRLFDMPPARLGRGYAT
jgi:hypothetical protein